MKNQKISRIISKNDLDFSKEFPGYSNILLITGLSGSGKSHLSNQLAEKYNATIFQPEWLNHEKHIPKNFLHFFEDFKKKYPEVVPYMKNKWDNCKIEDNNLLLKKYMNLLFKEFLASIDKDKLYIVEGLQLFTLIDFDLIKSFPIIIKRTSSLKALKQRLKRDLKNRKGFAQKLKYFFKAINQSRLYQFNHRKKLNKFIERKIKGDKKMIIFLTSDIGASKKVNGVRVVSELNNTNGFADNLKKAIKSHNLMVFVASSPFFEGTRTYAELTRNSLSLAGIKFNDMVILDGSNMSKCKELMEKADLVFLAGGDTEVQMKLFENMNLRKYITKSKGVIVGQSAGALNLATNVYCSPTPDESSTKKYWKGLGLTEVSIEPHFKPENKDLIEKILLPDSKTKPFIAITDGSYIIDDGEKQIVYGEAYLFSNGKVEQICQNGKSLKL